MSADRSDDPGTTRAEGREEGLEPFRILFVCTGNTCRSAMAETVARRKLSERGWHSVEVTSAGVSALTGVPASQGARDAAEARGYDLDDHESAQLTRERVERADLVLVMTPAHRDAVEQLGGEGKTALLGAFAADDDSGSGTWAVPDPYGGDEAVYRETLDALERMVERALSRIEPLVTP